MGSKFGIALVVAVLVIAALIYAASTQTKKAVVRVDELLVTGEARHRVRLGGRLTDGAISVTSQPERQVKFSVHDIPDGVKVIPVTFNGAMPDTLKPGRDVILEGDFDGKQFVAKSLMTQCPSKYVPPTPGQSGTVSSGTGQPVPAQGGPAQARPDQSSSSY